MRLKTAQQETRPSGAKTSVQRQALPAALAPAEALGATSSLINLQRTHGNRFVRRLVQTKLAISRPGDVHEREADRVAEAVMRMPASERQTAPDIKGMSAERAATAERERLSSAIGSDVQRVEAAPTSAAAPAHTEADAPTAATAPAAVEDEAIEALDLQPATKEAAVKLKAKHPEIIFKSGRRNVSEQASAMASNILKDGDRKWIEKTYTTAGQLQKWVDDNPQALTRSDLAKGLRETMETMSERSLGYISKHLSGEAFDVQPQTKDAEEIKKDMRELPGLHRFLEKEGGLVRWHAQFKKKGRATKADDQYEREAERVSEHVVHRAGGSNTGTPQSQAVHVLAETAMQRSAEGDEPLTENAMPLVDGVLRSSGKPLDAPTRNFMEQRFNQDFSHVRIHSDARAAESAHSVNALAYTVGQHVVFGAGQYAPSTEGGKKLLAHELTHVIQQTGALEPLMQRFTAELGEDRRVYVKPEKGDTDADLNRILCAGAANRKIAGRESIDVTECLPRGVIKSMELGPYNCAQFAAFALRGETSPKARDKDGESLFTVRLWHELLSKGYRVAGFAMVDDAGQVKQAKTKRKISWQQLSPRMGDVVFMMGNIILNKGAKEPNPSGDNFSVDWDHVGFFIVRSRTGVDYHLAKDGDEKPINVYHTDETLAEYEPEGAYVRGKTKFMTYLTLAEAVSETKDEKKPAGKGGK